MNAGAKPKNWRNALLPLAQAVLHASCVDSPLAGAIDSFRNAWTAFDSDERPPAQALWEQAFALAVADALRTGRVDVQQNQGELAVAVADFLADAFQAATGFGEAELLDPTGFAADGPVRDAFPDFVRRIDPAYAEEADEQLRDRLDKALRRGLVRAWSDDVRRFEVIVDRLQDPVAERARREAAWMRHYAWVRATFEEATVFSPSDDQKVRLASVYVRLRCAWHEAQGDAAAPEPGRPQQRRKHRAHVGLLHEAVRAWLEAGAAGDPVRIVAGGPGSGRSSFARAFATEAILETGWRVVFVELQHLRLAGDLRSNLRRYFDHRKASDGGFFQDPLDWYAGCADKCLLVFDGLDELAETGAGATDLTRRFVANLKMLLHVGRAEERPPKALVLGRCRGGPTGRRSRPPLSAPRPPTPPADARRPAARR